ncbi:M48 family metalloprotease [Galbitalea soli]|uniref:Protease HtpX homolog n=1 Tax=Galbitalea soli TaxID=1268042 RepID=A0A7C9PM24_9MICO|nr:M48 family metalloprotease [Galbitalea soli]NEM90673.1 M48 family metalloprotease [Galbitalea soli]NYJ31391.1 heat shock protein HtpX [Galbitalea soli]
MYRAIAANKRNTVLIISLFLVIVAAIGFAVNYLWGGGRYGDYSIFIFVVIGAGLYTLIQYFAAASQALAITGAMPIQKADNPRLYRIVENLAITTGMPMPKVYIINDPAPNAFATGRDPKHAVVAATTGILEIMDDDELEGVMAHEMGHVQNYDIRVSTLVFGLVVAIGFIADVALRLSFFGGFGGNNRDNNNNGGGGGGNPIVLVIGIVALIISPIVAAIIQAAISRQREYLADATSAMTTRNPGELESALKKLGEYGRPVRRQNSSMAHMWIADPNKPGMIEKLFSTHPPIADRIARLDKMGGSF